MTSAELIALSITMNVGALLYIIVHEVRHYVLARELKEDIHDLTTQANNAVAARDGILRKEIALLGEVHERDSKRWYEYWNATAAYGVRIHDLAVAVDEQDQNVDDLLERLVDMEKKTDYTDERLVNLACSVVALQSKKGVKKCACS